MSDNTLQVEQVKKVYFIGIGGIGMSALARYFLFRGAAVSGYDRTPSILTQTLTAEGMLIHYEDNPLLCPADVDLVVYTPAIPASHQELQWYRTHSSIPVLKRSEVLQLLTDQHYTIAIAGSHGKTSVTSMTAHILHHSGYGCTAFVGGIMTNYNANFVCSNTDVIVVEADEFDRSFLRLNPNVAVITAVDTDHLDIYGSQEVIEATFLQFATQVKEDGYLVVKSTIPILQRLPERLYNTYHAQNSDADYCLSDVNYDDTHLWFSIQSPLGNIEHLSLPKSGLHNAENALAAIAVAQYLGVSSDKIKAAVSTFTGIKRRFEYIIRQENLVLIDDYAHHPEEIRTLLHAVRHLYPTQKVSIVFQPHLYSRTKDLYREFAAVLQTADEIILLDIYPARELPIDGVTADLIFKHIDNPNKISCTKQELLSQLTDRTFEVLLTVGAGDIDTYLPAISALLQNP